MKLYSGGGKYSGAPKKGSEDPRNAPKRNKKKSGSKKRTFLVVTLVVLMLVLAVLLFLMLRYVIAAKDFKDLSAQVQHAAATTYPEYTSATEAATEPVLETEPGETVETQETEPVETEPPVRTILPQYGDLYQQNTELYGWIRIDGTVIDYPVMRSFDDPEKYLHANFKGEYSYPGIPFADSKCSNDSDNILIYAHNMLDGSMFRGLIKYENKSYWEANPIIMYSDLYEDYEYEVVAAFYDRVYLKSDTCFKFYQFIDAENEEDFDYAISQFKEKALYETGVEAEYGDKLITLITCAYHVENGRFVVVARRK